MNILQVNNVDLPGRIYNGYNLVKSLNGNGHNAIQIVNKKYGNDNNSKQLGNDKNSFSEWSSIKLEEMFSLNALIGIGAKQLEIDPDFIAADIVHYHLVHNRLITLLDFPKLTKRKASVWTVHDPWIVTGHCIHPFECKKWLTGCVNCESLDEHFSLRIDTAHQMWKIKQQVYKEMNIDLVVASKFMEDYIKSSPFSESFKNVHRIPFGVKLEDYEVFDKETARKDLQIPKTNFVIGFRNDEIELKGYKYIYQMLDMIVPSKEITIITLGYAKLPLEIKGKFHTVELGWQNDDSIIKKFYASCSVFVMPSLAESFGLMSVEAMASGVPVVVFEDTVLPEITFSPACGIAVPYKSSLGMKAAVERLMQNPEEGKKRGRLGKEIVKEHYNYNVYVKKHLELYEDIGMRNKIIN